VCVTCRTALYTGENCADDASHTVVELSSGIGRKILIDEVWEGRGFIQKVIPAKDSTSAPYLFGLGVLGAVAGGVLTIAPLMAVGAFGMCAGTVASLAGGSATRFIRTKTGRIRARAPRGDKARKRHPVAGRVLEAEEAPSPLSGVQCVAFDIELRLGEGRSEGVLLDDSAARAFRIEVDSGGDIIEIPAGHALILGAPAEEVEPERVERYLCKLDRWRDPDGHHEPFPYDHVVEHVVCVGDRVAVHNELERGMGRATDGHAYRTGAMIALHPVGKPVIEVLDVAEFD
jgi:hypothetical protein